MASKSEQEKIGASKETKTVETVKRSPIFKRVRENRQRFFKLLQLSPLLIDFVFPQNLNSSIPRNLGNYVPPSILDTQSSSAQKILPFIQMPENSLDNAVGTQVQAGNITANPESISPDEDTFVELETKEAKYKDFFDPDELSRLATTLKLTGVGESPSALELREIFFSTLPTSSPEEILAFEKIFFQLQEQKEEWEKDHFQPKPGEKCVLLFTPEGKKIHLKENLSSGEIEINVSVSGKMQKIQGKWDRGPEGKEKKMKIQEEPSLFVKKAILGKNIFYYLQTGEERQKTFSYPPTLQYGGSARKPYIYIPHNHTDQWPLDYLALQGLLEYEQMLNDILDSVFTNPKVKAKIKQESKYTLEEIKNLPWFNLLLQTLIAENIDGNKIMQEPQNNKAEKAVAEILVELHLNESDYNYNKKSKKNAHGALQIQSIGARILTRIWLREKVSKKEILKRLSQLEKSLEISVFHHLDILLSLEKFKYSTDFQDIKINYAQNELFVSFTGCKQEKKLKLSDLLLISYYGGIKAVKNHLLKLQGNTKNQISDIYATYLKKGKSALQIVSQKPSENYAQNRIKPRTWQNVKK